MHLALLFTIQHMNDTYKIHIDFFISHLKWKKVMRLKNQINFYKLYNYALLYYFIFTKAKLSNI